MTEPCVRGHSLTNVNRARARLLLQLRPWAGLCAVACSVLAPAELRADDLAAALYVRTDTDATTVVSPHARVGKQLGEATRVDVTYAADVWTSASIDIATSASVRPVTEQRDELDVAVSHDMEDLKLNAAYRFSTENDYTSHGLSLGGSYDFADNAATLDLSLHAIADTVGRSGDPSFSRGLATLDTRLSLTQVIDTETIAQATYELAYDDGYQASPYRYVGIDGTGEGCIGALQCLPEHTPDTRTRHALALQLRRALGYDVSAGITYRYYFDAWGLDSHTFAAQLGWNAAQDTLLTLQYRFYTQGSASFYRALYMSIPTPTTYTTRDRELSPLSYHRIAAVLEHGFPFETGERLTATLSLGGSFYSYGDFIGLTSVRALEVTTALVLTM